MFNQTKSQMLPEKVCHKSVNDFDLPRWKKRVREGFKRLGWKYFVEKTIRFPLVTLMYSLLSSLVMVFWIVCKKKEWPLWWSWARLRCWDPHDSWCVAAHDLSTAAALLNKEGLIAFSLVSSFAVTSAFVIVAKRFARDETIDFLNTVISDIKSNA